MAEEQRKAPRKILKVKAVFLLADAEPLTVRTTDISAEGVGMTLDSPIAVGRRGKIVFTMFYSGKAHEFRAMAKVVHCIFSGDAFKAGLLFTQIDADNALEITNYFKQP